MFTEIDTLKKQAKDVKDEKEREAMMNMVGELELGLQEVSQEENYAKSNKIRKIRKKRI